MIEIDRPLQPGQVRNSAAHALEALVTTYGGVPRRLPVVGDTVEETRAALLSCLDCDLIVTIGGVSMGDYDLVRNVLGAEGEIDFWRIRMRPGKPLAFGHIEGTANAAETNVRSLTKKLTASVIPAQAGIQSSISTSADTAAASEQHCTRSNEGQGGSVIPARPANQPSPWGEGQSEKGTTAPASDHPSPCEEGQGEGVHYHRSGNPSFIR